MAATRSGDIAASCGPQLGQSWSPSVGKSKCPLYPPAAVVGEKAAVAALSLVAVADHGCGITAPKGAGAEHPDPGVVLHQQGGVNVGVVPLPPAQLGQAPYVAGIDATPLHHAGG